MNGEALRGGDSGIRDWVKRDLEGVFEETPASGEERLGGEGVEWEVSSDPTSLKLRRTYVSGG